MDNNSTDNTTELARRAAAQVVFEPFNQIARARNAGADVATGDWFLFLDADTLVSTETMTDLLAAIENGRLVGGSAEIHFGPIRPPIRVLVAFGNFLIRSLKLTAVASFSAAPMPSASSVTSTKRCSLAKTRSWESR